jgi:putative peptidoglycan lipid II flippase
MTSPRPDAGKAWTDAESQPGPRRPPAAAGGGGRHRAPGAHRARAATDNGTDPRPSAASAPSPAGPSLVRSSSVMALGTLASRVTGLLRSIVLLFALGTVFLANAYNYANTLPNTVYNLAIGGILTSVIVPLLVSAAKRDSDRGERYSQRMFTLVTLFLGIITLAATLAAGPIATLYGCANRACSPGSAQSADYRHLLIIFAYFFIPQIFFYGVSSLAGAILNARGHFAAPMWTPVVNNIVVIAVIIAFMVLAGVHQTVSTITPLEVRLLGIGTTLGIIAQTAALIPALRRVGFRWRPRFDFKRADMAEIGRMSGWMFGYVVTTQVAFLVTAKVAAKVSNPALTGGVGKGFTAYSNAWLLFQLPYAIVGISVITALLPRMSAHASERRYDLVQSDFSTGVRLGSVIVAPAALVLAVIGPSLAEILLGWGNTTIADARYLGLVFSIFSLGLVPYMLFQLLLRVFYSLHDSRTPALVGVATMVTNVVANLIALAVMPPGDLVAALGVGFGLANTVGAVLAWIVLSRRLGGLAGRQVGASLAKMHAAAVPAALFALAVVVVVTLVLSTGKIAALLIVVVGGAGALVCYLAASRALRVTEVTDLTAMVRSRLHR